MTRLFLHHELDSTNAEAERMLCDQGYRDDAVIVAEAQISGKGKGSRSWISCAGGAAVTFIHKKRNETALHTSAVSIISAIALIDLLREMLPQSAAGDLQMKWPNDVLWNGQKIAGILSKKISRDGDDYYIIGSGVNLVSSPVELPSVALLQIAGANAVIPGGLAFADALHRKWSSYCSADNVNERMIADYERLCYSPVKFALYNNRTIISSWLNLDGSLCVATNDNQAVTLVDSDALQWSHI